MVRVPAATVAVGATTRQAAEVAACPVVVCRACRKAAEVVAVSVARQPAWRWISGLSEKGKQPGGTAHKVPCLSAVRQSSKDLPELLAVVIV
ncbi:hypothetical protein GCM10007901_14570 [Dyella acidisoli]|uniref:Secreted protein n=1 Tax=Dyella acidisoli TaxID=1867834 RepID=A0ABQ5XMS2_9GAMM|nr:hypothetical protein GCM10007901_14570 [Dyella acidisoli]